jgi:hypothetical protein
MWPSLLVDDDLQTPCADVFTVFEEKMENAARTYFANDLGGYDLCTTSVYWRVHRRVGGPIGAEVYAAARKKKGSSYG